MKLKLFRINLNLGQKISKHNTEPSILRGLALEILNVLYPEQEWLRILTDGSLMSDSPNAGAGDFSKMFSFYVPEGQGTAFYGKIVAIRTALYQLQCQLEKFTRAVILSDSRVALLAVAYDNNPITHVVLD
ncbi:hypothetical protein TNIN_63241 [Trichonephila inaurata madagascariensis]|uniref:RNase H type-1 domain-containing protein n=1 Tax=Trichonephila inaurata madagascariensis TaxID=2747483 RepID=A0A8X6WLN1_9ARAC|nr:hypothetical protein TNIN_63241 [Trichonephila inaurata madagascariensis]